VYNADSAERRRRFDVPTSPSKEFTLMTMQPLVIPLWPDGAPGSEAWDQIEAQTTFPDGFRLVHNVTQPSLEAYPAQSPNGTAVIVAPGGAWHFLSIEHEGR
jgi:hypothetical protein